MPRFITRHITALLVTLVVGWWAIFYLPRTPTWAVLWLRNAVQNRDGDAAVRYIDFQSVVQHAAKDMVEQNEGDPNLQIPAAAVAGARVRLHRQGDSAWTKLTDREGQTWEIHLLWED